jgi:hypothetical protein
VARHTTEPGHERYGRGDPLCVLPQDEHNLLEDIVDELLAAEIML